MSEFLLKVNFITFYTGWGYFIFILLVHHQ